MKIPLTGSLLIMLLTSSTVLPAAEPLGSQLARQLPLLGHRNWIIIADAAYPLQTSPGIETICVETDQLAALDEVLAQLARTQHVRPLITTDAELPFVPERHAPGIEAYRSGLATRLAGRPVQVLPHEQIIAELDEAGRTFKVLLIKTPLTLPYTSVFIRLECGYWTAAAEKEMREAMRTTARP